jgi:hypothetical protein
VRLWVIAGSYDGVSDVAEYEAAHCVSLLWWQWREHLWPHLRDGQKLPFVDEPERCFKANAPSSIHPNADREFELLMRLGYLEGPFEHGSGLKERQDRELDSWRAQEGRARQATHVRESDRVEGQREARIH